MGLGQGVWMSPSASQAHLGCRSEQNPRAQALLQRPSFPRARQQESPQQPAWCFRREPPGTSRGRHDLCTADFPQPRRIHIL